MSKLENVVEEVADIELIKKELEATKLELAKVTELNTQYENAYRMQSEKYDNLFGLFANMVEYTISSTNVRKGN